MRVVQLDRAEVARLQQLYRDGLEELAGDSTGSVYQALIEFRDRIETEFGIDVEEGVRNGL